MINRRLHIASSRTAGIRRDHLKITPKCKCPLTFGLLDMSGGFKKLKKLELMRDGIEPFLPEQMVLEEGSTAERDEIHWQAYQSELITHADYKLLARIESNSTVSNRKRKREEQGEAYEHKTLESDEGKGSSLSD